MLVHTGQHYDDELSRSSSTSSASRGPSTELDLGGGTNTEQTARMLGGAGAAAGAERRPTRARLRRHELDARRRRWPAAQAGIPVAHVEAGMRSFDRAMPEELNRVLTDHAQRPAAVPVADAPSDNLRARGSRASRPRRRRDGRRRAAVRSRARGRDEALDAGVEPGGYVLVTAHRAGNVDDPGSGSRGSSTCCSRCPRRGAAAAPAHARAARGAGLLGRLGRPASSARAAAGYLDFTALLLHARAVLTDSGGVQKEAYLAGVPCVTLRDTTEWTETVDAGWNVLVDLDARRGAGGAERARRRRERPQLYGDGRAGERVVSSLSA